MRKFECEDGQMLIGGIPAVDIAEEFGTPVYVTDETALRGNFRRISGAFNRQMETRTHFACKANTNLAILRVLQQEGAYIDAVSIGEVELCLRAGFPPERILYTGVMATNAELEQVAAHGVPINIDSFGEMRRLAKISPGHPVSFRVNPDVGAGHHAHVVTGAKTTKFGVQKEAAVNAYAEAIALGLEPFGIHAHIGAGVQDPEPFVRVTEVLCSLYQDIKDITGLKLKVVDIGGGVGIPYHVEDSEMDVDQMAKEVCSRIKACGASVAAIEPGRYIVADTTVLLTTVHDIKDNPDKRFAGVDAGFNTLIRPAFYGSFHHVAVANKFNAPGELVYDIVGPICETGDHIAKERKLPRLAEGDVIAVYDTGAYGFTMSSNYNSRGRAAEVLVKDGEASLVRERESIEDLFRHQRLPSRLML
jgi:diaminopimelate decarboxylase